MDKPCKYVRDHYGVPAEIGRLVVVNGKPGVIAQDGGHYIGVLFDEDAPGTVYPCHPTWRVEYQGMGCAPVACPQAASKRALPAIP